MVSSISQQTQSLAYEMAQISATSVLQSSTKIERLNYDGLSESEKESLRQKYSQALEEYNLDELDFYENIDEVDESEEEYLDLSLTENTEEVNNDFNSLEKESSTQDEISYYASKYSEISDELAPQITNVNLNLSGYNKYNYNKINSAYAPKITYAQSNVKVYA